MKQSWPWAAAALAALLATLTHWVGADEDPGEEPAAAIHQPQAAAPAGYEFETPVRLKAGDKFIAVESPGYACPTLADVDGDGKEDLVVGQFNQGHMQFCKNVAEAGQPPKYAASEWIMTGGDRAVVPGVW